MTASSAAKARTKRPPPRAGPARRKREHNTDAFVVTSLTIAGTRISGYDLLIVAVSMR